VVVGEAAGDARKGQCGATLRAEPSAVAVLGLAPVALHASLEYLPEEGTSVEVVA
jgi:hypothetical protein